MPTAAPPVGAAIRRPRAPSGRPYTCHCETGAHTGCGNPYPRRECIYAFRYNGMEYAEQMNPFPTTIQMLRGVAEKVFILPAGSVCPEAEDVQEKIHSFYIDFFLFVVYDKIAKYRMLEQKVLQSLLISGITLYERGTYYGKA